MNFGARQAARALKDRPGRIWSEPRTAHTLRCYLGRDRDICDLSGIPVTGDLVVVNQQWIRRGGFVPAEPPPNWRRIEAFVPSYRGRIRSGTWARRERPEEARIIYEVGPP